MERGITNFKIIMDWITVANKHPLILRTVMQLPPLSCWRKVTHFSWGCQLPPWHACINQIRSVAQSCPTLCDPMNCSTPGLPVHHQLLEITQTHVHQVSDAIQPCINSPPILYLFKFLQLRLFDTNIHVHISCYDDLVLYYRFIINSLVY